MVTVIRTAVTVNASRKADKKAADITNNKDKSILDTFSIRGLPTTFIANKDFKVFAKVEGVIEWESQVFLNWLYLN